MSSEFLLLNELFNIAFRKNLRLDIIGDINNEYMITAIIGNHKYFFHEGFTEKALLQAITLFSARLGE